MSSGGGGGGPRFNNPLDDMNDIFQGAIDAASSAVDRAGRNFGQDLRETAYVLGTGDLNNVGNSILNRTSNILTYGQMNPNLETGSERKEGEQTRAKEIAEEEMHSANARGRENDKQRRIVNILEGSAKQRMKSPGSVSVIPGGNNGSNTLLSTKGGS